MGVRDGRGEGGVVSVWWSWLIASGTASCVSLVLFEWYGDHRDVHRVDRRQRQMCISDRNGLDLYLAIRRITPSVVAIMIAGLDDEFATIAKEAVQQNAYAIVKKPLEIDLILDMLCRIMGRRISGDHRKPPLPGSRGR